MNGERLIGMVQPIEPDAPEPPPVFAKGCAGKITAFAETPDRRVPVETPVLDRGRLEPALRRYVRQHGLDADWEAVRQTADERLVTSLAMICPFAASEKQALLEAPTLKARADALLALVEIGTLENGRPGAAH
jgi:Lon protease-like protein